MSGSSSSTKSRAMAGRRARLVPRSRLRSPGSTRRMWSGSSTGPLVTSPNHPEYPAAHGTNTSAMAEVFSEFLGTDEIDLDLRGFDAAGAPGNLDAVRHYDTTAELRNEIIGARLWAGLHYRRSSEACVHLGRKVAH